MDNFPTFPFTTQEDWYGELSFISAEDNSPLSLEGRNFEMLITPAASGADLVEPKITLTMDDLGGLSLKNGDSSTIIFRVPKATANQLVRMEYTADILEVVGDSRYLFMPARIDYFEPSALRIFLSRFLGVSVSFAARRQPIVTPVAVPGRQGDRGNSILSGFRAPGSADGKIGDFWMDLGSETQAPRLYGPKLGAGWPAQYLELITDRGLSGALERAGQVTPIPISAEAGNLAEGQTSFAIPGGYTPGTAMVFRNGVLLQPKDYTASDGVNLVMAQPARIDDVIIFSRFRVGGFAAGLEEKLDRAILSRSGPPVTGDIPSGTIRVVKDTTAGRISLYANDAGQIIDLLYFEV